MPISDKKNTLPFRNFLSHLKRQGFIIGVDHYLRLQTILNIVGNESRPYELKYLLCPIFAATEKQQRQFYNTFNLYFKPEELLPAKESTDSDDPIEISPPEPKPIEAEKWPYVLLGVLFLVIIAVIGYRQVKTLQKLQDIEKPPVSQEPGTTTDSTATSAPEEIAVSTGVTTDYTGSAPQNHPATPDKPESDPTFYDLYWQVIQWIGILTPIIIFFLTEWYRFNRRKLFLQKQLEKKPPNIWPIKVETPEPGFMKKELFYTAARAMRQRLKSEVYQPDIDQTIHHTIESGGFPEKFCYKPMTKPAEYLVLIDLPSSRDHRAHFSGHIAEALENEDVHVTRYFYKNNPRICFRNSSQDRFYLSDLRAKYYGHRLILFGNGKEMFDPVSGETEEWAVLFRTWRERAIFTPKRPKDWGLREAALAKEFILLPGSLESLTVLVDHFENQSTPDLKALYKTDSQKPGIASDKLTDVNALRDYLGKDAFQWLCACAVYPELHWNLTLYIGTLSCMPDNLASEENLLRLIGLPWFHKGTMPDKLRWELINALDKEKLQPICTAIVEILEKNPPSKESIAYDKYCLNLAVQKWMPAKKSRKEKQELLKVLKAVDRKEVVQDYTFLRLLESLPKSLSLVLPQRLSKVIFSMGVPVFGLKTGIRAVLTVFLVVAAFLLIHEPSQYYKYFQKIKIPGISWFQNAQLYVNTIPEQATINILQSNQRYKPGITLEPGRQYTLEVSAEGYETRREKIVMLAGKNTVYISLDPETRQRGRLFVSTIPESATVKFVRSNLEFSQGMGLQAGVHELEVSANGYESKKYKTEIFVGKITRLNMRLEKLIGKLKLYVNTQPEDARVKILNISSAFQQGMDLETGRYHIEVSAMGYVTRRQWEEIDAERNTIDIVLSAEKARMGQLYVNTQPENAKVRILNIAPRYRKGMELKLGRYHIEVSAKGYVTHRKWEDIDVGGNTIDIVLQAEEVRMGQLYVNTRPEDAKVRILNIAPRYRKGMELEAGRQYNLEVSRSDYKTYRKTIKLATGRNRVTIILEPEISQAGRLYVTTEPSTATVKFLNSNVRFQDGMELDSGLYQLEFSAEDYEKREERVNIAAGQETRLNIRLTRTELRAGRLFVKTVPPNARVRLPDIGPRYEDGMELSPGTYRLEVSADAYEPRTMFSNITAGDNIISVNLKKKSATETTGSLIVNRVPEGARVRIVSPRDMEYEEGMSLSSGEYRIEVSAAGYEPQTESVTIKAEMPETVKIVLTPKKTTLIVTCNVENAFVCINKADEIKIFSCDYSGNTPYGVGGIEAGRYVIIVKKYDYENYSKEIQISLGESKEIYAKLRERDALVED